MELLDYKEAAALLRCSPLTLRKKVMMRKIPHLKPYGPRGRVLFVKDDLEKFLIDSRVVPLHSGRKEG